MKAGKKIIASKKKLLRQTDRLTRPPRLEGKVKNAKLNSAKKKPGTRKIPMRNIDIPPSPADENRFLDRK